MVSELPVSHEWIEHGKNGVIERAGVNPLEEAVNLLDTGFALANKNRIDELADKAVTKKLFYDLYLRLEDAQA